MPLVLEDLPQPPPERTGWPWTEGSEPLPATRPDGSQWPRITIVTPSYNQGEFIEETIRSVLSQGYPNLQYMVIDGGSNDATVDVISRYALWINFWVSERDEGQSHAINKGLARADGEWFQFINSDDLLTSGALRAVALAVGRADTVAGPVIDFGAGPEVITSNRNLTCAHMLRCHGFIPSDYHQPGVFMRTARLRELGGFDESYRYVFDYKLMVRYLDLFPSIAWIDQPLARFRFHDTSKTVHEGHKFRQELERARSEFLEGELRAHYRYLLRAILRAQKWPEEVLRRLQSRSRRLQNAGFLLKTIFTDPLVACNRYTIGALRRIVIGF